MQVFLGIQNDEKPLFKRKAFFKHPKNNPVFLILRKKRSSITMILL